MRSEALEAAPATTARDLFVLAQTPALGSGQALRIYTLARALSGARGGLVLLYSRFGAAQPDAAFRSIPGIELHEVVPSRGWRRALTYARCRLTRMPAAWSRGVSPELVAEAGRLAGRLVGGRVIADGPVVAAALDPLARRRAVIYNAHNLESAFRHQLGERGLGSAAAFRAAERRLLARFAESWMVSELDVDGARELCPAAAVRYVPNVVDVEAIEPPTARAPEPRMLMVADFTYAPNRSGLRFLLDEVLPRVWARRPEARLMLVGRGFDRPPGLDPRVETLGFVPDLATAYGRARCVLVPLLQGGGTPLKLIEALAYGVPAVATPRAAAALTLTPGHDCLTAQDADEFAAAACRLLGDDELLAIELARQGRAHVEARYSIAALTRLVAPGATVR